MTTVKKYPVKMNYRFNLDSMRTHALVILDEMRDGEIETVHLMGQDMDETAVERFIEEIEELMSKMYYPVSGKDYGRIKAISDERNMIRYATCISKGMSENDAASAFFE